MVSQKVFGNRDLSTQGQGQYPIGSGRRLISSIDTKKDYGSSRSALFDLDPEKFGHTRPWILPLGGHFGGQVNDVSGSRGIYSLSQFHLQFTSQLNNKVRMLALLICQ